MSKQINLVINGKGGVEKSFFASNFVQYLKDCGIAHCAIDSDRENAILTASTNKLQAIIDYKASAAKAKYCNRVYTARRAVCWICRLPCNVSVSERTLVRFNWLYLAAAVRR